MHASPQRKRPTKQRIPRSTMTIEAVVTRSKVGAMGQPNGEQLIRHLQDNLEGWNMEIRTLGKPS
jgi:hypothetical protein